MIRIRRGLDVPLDGAPAAFVETGPEVRTVALMPGDHPGLKARLAVDEGDSVQPGQTLFRDRHAPEIRCVSPHAGRVVRIHRGERRRVQSVVVEVEGDETRTLPTGAARGELDVRERLLASGLWTALRTRPFGRIPRPGDRADAIFVTAMDTNPLAGSLDAVWPTSAEDFARGIEVLTHLTAGRVHVCKAPSLVLDPLDLDRVDVHAFAGPHPAGLPGTHIHHIASVYGGGSVFYVGWQDVAAIGVLFETGRVRTECLVALGGSPVRRPRWLRTSLGACVTELLEDELERVPCRVISGSPLSGRQATGWGAYLGRYDSQVSVLPEAGEGSAGSMTTALHGQVGPMVPIDRFERVLPLRILAAPLLRALLIGDVDSAARLGCLELEEEDLALCSFVCPGKIEYGPLLRAALDELAQDEIGGSA